MQSKLQAHEGKIHYQCPTSGHLCCVDCLVNEAVTCDHCGDLILIDAKTAKTSYKGRYTCVNLTNDTTIEFRMFRGTLKYNTLIATLQFVERICDVAVYKHNSIVFKHLQAC